MISVEVKEVLNMRLSAEICLINEQVNSKQEELYGLDSSLSTILITSKSYVLFKNVE